MASPLADFFRAVIAPDKHAQGTRIKIAQAKALDASWYGIVPRVPSPGPKSQLKTQDSRLKTSSGSLVFPESQEKRIFKKVDDVHAMVRDDVRNVIKTGNLVAAGLGAGAMATIGLAGAILWTRAMSKPDNLGHYPTRKRIR